MSQLDAAQRHLTRALRRLEAALQQRLARTTDGSAAADPQALAQVGEPAELSRNLAVLHEQCDRLSVALSEAQHDNRTLRETNGRVARRLDGSIGELDRLLGS